LDNQNLWSHRGRRVQPPPLTKITTWSIHTDDLHEPQDDTVVQVPQINGIDLMGNPQYFVNRKWMQSKLKNIDTVLDCKNG
jgi:hypothetical protein